MKGYLARAPRILPHCEVRGYINRNGGKNADKAFEFFYEMIKKESSSHAKADTEEEFGVTLCIERVPEIPFREKWPKHIVYKIYVG